MVSTTTTTTTEVPPPPTTSNSTYLSQPAPAHSFTTTTTTPSSTPSFTFGLPFAPSVLARLQQLISSNLLQRPLDREVLSKLSSLPEQMGVHSIDKLCERDVRIIRNPSGFFNGILKRVQSETTSSAHDGNQAMYATSALPPPVSAKLSYLYQTGIIQPHELDPTIIQSIGRYPVDVQIMIIDRFSQARFEQIRNKSGYMVGVIRRVKEELGMM